MPPLPLEYQESCWLLVPLLTAPLKLWETLEQKCTFAHLDPPLRLHSGIEHSSIAEDSPPVEKNFLSAPTPRQDHDGVALQWEEFGSSHEIVGLCAESEMVQGHLGR